MNSEIVVGAITIHLYGVIVGVAIVVGWWWAEKQAGRRGMKAVEFERLSVWGIVGGVIGARLYHVIDYWDYYATDYRLILAVWNGGLAIWGAIIGGMMGAAIGARGKWQQMWRWWDMGALALPLSQAVGRWGNWVNGELYGRETWLPWGIWVNGVRVQPLFLYESLLNLLLFWVMNWKLKYRYQGQATGAYLIGYGLIRLGLEPMRTRIWQVGEIAVAQVVAVAAILLGGGLWLNRKIRM